MSDRLPTIEPTWTPPCPPPSEHDLTPSEVALAVMLAKLVEYTSACPGGGEPRRCHDVLERTKEALFTDTNRALLDRARRAGVL